MNNDKHEFNNDIQICEREKENINLSKLDECIKEIANNEGCISYDVVTEIIDAEGGNYLGTWSTIDIKGKTLEGNKEIAIFVKTIPIDCGPMELFSVSDVYRTELFVYKELAKIFDELQDSANIPAKERYKTVKFYGESFETAIMMENIKKNGFDSVNHKKGAMTLKIAEECIKQMSKLHGLSFILEHRKPKYFNNIIKPMAIPYIFCEAWNEYATKMTEMGLDRLDNKLSNKVEKTLPLTIKKLKEYYSDESIKYCLCHGGYRPNNLMVKEEDGKISVIPVDYQTIHYGCPVFDFIYFMYMSTNRQFRNSHMDYLKNFYYKSLTDYLQLFNFSAESVLPKKTFDLIYREKLDYGLANLFVICPLHFVFNAEITNGSDKVVEDMDFEVNENVKTKLTEAVEEFIELGYL